MIRYLRSIAVARPRTPLRACDFCGQTQSTVGLPAGRFDTPHGVSRGDWQACGDCAALVVGNQWAGVAERVLDQFDEYEDELAVLAVREQLTALYGLLRVNMTGEPYLLSGAGQFPGGTFNSATPVL